MSECRSQIQIVQEVLPLVNADTLEIAKVLGWFCVVGKGQYKAGDKCLYIPVDSVLPDELVEVIFKNSKIKPDKGRIKTIKIRKAISQGLVVALETLGLDPKLKEGTDLTDKLGIKKYEPPEASLPAHMRQGKKIKKYNNSNFKKYTDIQNIKWHPTIFGPEDFVSITEKIHGCFRGDTQITLIDGSKKTIQEIVENKLSIDVLSVDSFGNLVSSKILNWFDNGRTDEWVNVKTERNSAGRGNCYASNFNTPNHEYFVWPKNGEEIGLDIDLKDCFFIAKDLNPGDEIMQSCQYECLSSHQLEVLTGKMLGDGCLVSSSIEFRHKKSHESYVDYILKLLTNIAGEKQKPQISGFGTVMIPARTRSVKMIEDYFQDWFENEKKEVPHYLYLSPLTLAIWYMDDGSLSHSDMQEDRASFATCGFSEQSVDNLIGSLKMFHGFNAVKQFSEEKYWRIRLNKDDADKFFQMIAPYVCECMRYKLPEKYRSVPFIEMSSLLDPVYQSHYEWIYSREKVISISEVPDSITSKMNKKRYDIETTHHNFFANDILVHNSNFRAGWVPYEANCWWKKALKFLHLAPEFEFVYGSHNVQLHEKPFKGFYKENVYAEAVVKYNLEKLIPKGHVIYGEIYGEGIQKGYAYGLKNERRLAIFDVQFEGRYIDYDSFELFCRLRDLPMVPSLYRGWFKNANLEAMYSVPSVLCPDQKVMEGVVVKDYFEGESAAIGRKILKVINPEYLLKDNTEFH